MAIAIDKHVTGLDIAVDDAVAMRVRQGTTHLHGDVELLYQRCVAPCNEAGQITTVDKLHDEVRHPVGDAAIDDVDDVGMAQTRNDE